MNRLAKKHWRVESEEWSPDLDGDGNYMGVESFQRGSSAPYSTEEIALQAAVEHLKMGRWVKVEQYGFDFNDKKED